MAGTNRLIVVRVVQAEGQRAHEKCVYHDYYDGSIEFLRRYESGRTILGNFDRPNTLIYASGRVIIQTWTILVAWRLER